MTTELIDKKAIREYRRKFTKLKRELKCSDEEAKFAMGEPDYGKNEKIKYNGK